MTGSILAGANTGIASHLIARADDLEGEGGEAVRASTKMALARDTRPFENML